MPSTSPTPKESLTQRPGLQSTVVVVQGIGCPAACGIFLDQGSNLSRLRWQVDSLPLSHRGSPGHCFEVSLATIPWRNTRPALPFVTFSRSPGGSVEQLDTPGRTCRPCWAAPGPFPVLGGNAKLLQPAPARPLAPAPAQAPRFGETRLLLVPWLPFLPRKISYTPPPPPEHLPTLRLPSSSHPPRT